MNIVLLSGGSGKRLWPLSNDAMSKQFLKLLHNDSGEKESMVQRVQRQLFDAIPNANLFVSCSASHVDSVKRQLGEKINISVEPERRDTFPAMVLSAAHLYYKHNCVDNDTMVVVPIDACAESEYFSTLAKMDNSLRNSDSNLVLMGIKPTYPSEKYGYLRVKDDNIVGFKEKPDLKTAESLLTENALWNGGVYCMRIGYVLNLARKYINFESYEDIIDNFAKLPKISADYEIAEKELKIGLVIYDGKWKDLGTWNTLSEELANNVIGDNVLLSDCDNTHVLNMLDTPLLVMGIKDSVIVTSSDGILITDKLQSAKMKSFAEQISQRAMFEQRRWGEYRVLDYVQHDDGTKVLTKRLSILDGKGISYQMHRLRQEVWTISNGEGEFVLNGERRTVKSGDVLNIPVGAKHSIRGIDKLEIIEVQIGSELEESDIERFTVFESNSALALACGRSQDV